jgi:hypothetical protein
VATDADATNRLAVASDAALFTHAGAGHQIKVNKATAPDTASLLFQTGWSGRAELGTTGSDDLAIKVSADGTAWTTALSVAPATGLLTGAALTQTQTDTTPGRLLKVGDFGLGGTAPLAGNIAVEDNTIAPGFLTYNTAAGSSGGPAGVDRGVLIHYRRVASGGEVQMLVVESGTGPLSGALFTRSRVTGVWGPWRRYFRDSDMLGTVAQTAGLPTGALFQHGSNANGLFERQANGWQQCLRTDLSAAAISTAEGGGFRSADITWTYPSAFLSGTKPVLQVTGESAALVGFGIVSLSATAVTFRVKAATSVGSAVSLQASATGRWSSMT